MTHSPVSFFFQTVIRFLFFMINVLAVYLLLRGHNAPGGGFIAGVATAISLVLLGLVTGLRELRGVMRMDPVRIAAFGLFLAVATGCAPALFGQPFLTQYNVHLEKVPLFSDLHLGTPLLFDAGVYFVVVGITCKILFVLGQSGARLRLLIEEERDLYSSSFEEPIDPPDHAEDLRWSRDTPSTHP